MLHLLLFNVLVNAVYLYCAHLFLFVYFTLDFFILIIYTMLFSFFFFGLLTYFVYEEDVCSVEK